MKTEMKPNGVVCAIDVNDYDQAVVDLAATFAKQANVDLDLLHVTLFANPVNAAWPAYVGSPDGMIQDNRLLQQIHPGVVDVMVRRHHLSGLPSDTILEFINRNQPQLVVLGTHGRRGLARLFGSVAEKILRQASCPVLVLRQRQNSQEIADLETRVAN